MQTNYIKSENNFHNIKQVLQAYSQNTSIKFSDNYSLHLGVFIEPYLSYVLEGKKTWESRFSINKSAPYYHVDKNDLLLIKKSGGPLLGIALITNVLFFKLDANSFLELQDQYRELLCIEDPLFWARKKTACYATLMQLDYVFKVDPLQFEKKDRRGWIVYKNFDSLLRI